MMNQFSGEMLEVCYDIAKNKRSVIIKEHNYAKPTGKTQVVVFDFDGTLTSGKTNRTTWEGLWTTWTVTDEKTIDEQRFVLMVSDQKPDLLPSIVVQSDGKFMTTTSSGFDNATVRKVRELLHHEKFLENGTAERARESGTEQNYNMIDGCVNNVPKKPRVIDGRVSVLDRLHIKQAERARKDNAQVQQQERTRKN